jgi:hypothetical protein
MGTRSRVGAAAAAALLLAVAVAAAPSRPAGPDTQPRSLEEAKRMVRMMDTIYVTGVLTTHRMYAHEPGTAAAVAWGKQVVKEVNARGWPKARIFAATNHPLNPDNAPADDFERAAAAAFVSGKSTLEKVAGARYRYATPIRVTEQSCLSCHVRNKVGDLLGGVSYDAHFLTVRK